MCCFSPVAAPTRLFARLFRRRAAPVHVADTRIFARLVGLGEQALIYSMQLSVGGKVAMILPVPVVPRSGDDALRFVDLSRYPTLFDDLSRVFDVPGPAFALSRGGNGSRLESRPKLIVHKVGAFVGSYVPSRGDFDRLDPRFRLPDSVWASMKRYDDWGFAVFQLDRGTKTRIHPMAFRFRTRDPERLFFPTVHIHDGQVHATARFDHHLYYQHDELDRVRDLTDARSWSAVAEPMVRLADTDGLVAPQVLGRRVLLGERENDDVWIERMRERVEAAG